MPEKKYQASATSSYRFGFNGKENDNDVKEQGNQQDYGMRIYDPRLGKFLSVDPITNKYPELTPYQFASNCPISGVDLDGLEFKASIKDGNLIFSAKLTIVNATDNLSNAQLNQLGANVKADFEKTYSKPSVTINIDGILIVLPKIIAQAEIEILNGIKPNESTSEKINTKYTSMDKGAAGIIVQLKNTDVPDDAETIEGGSTPDLDLKSQRNILTINVSQNNVMRPVFVLVL